MQFVCSHTHVHTCVGMYVFEREMSLASSVTREIESRVRGYNVHSELARHISTKNKREMCLASSVHSECIYDVEDTCVSFVEDDTCVCLAISLNTE